MLEINADETAEAMCRFIGCSIHGVSCFQAYIHAAFIFSTAERGSRKVIGAAVGYRSRQSSARLRIISAHYYGNTPVASLATLTIFPRGFKVGSRRSRDDVQNKPRDLSVSLEVKNFKASFNRSVMSPHQARTGSWRWRIPDFERGVSDNLNDRIAHI